MQERIRNEELFRKQEDEKRVLQEKIAELEAFKQAEQTKLVYYFGKKIINLNDNLMLLQKNLNY